MLKEVLSHMATVFSSKNLAEGKDALQNGYVLTSRLSDGLLKARVKGALQGIYDVHLDLKVWPQKPAHCSCGEGIHCMHVVASLLALQEREKIVLDTPPVTTLDATLKNWLKTLNEPTSQALDYEVCYLLEIQKDSKQENIPIHLALAKRLKRGGLGKKVIFNSITPHRKQFFSAIDEEIIAALLFKHHTYDWFKNLFLCDSALLEKMLLTNRAYLLHREENLLQYGPVSASKLYWRLDKNGAQHIELGSDNETFIPILLDKPWYYNPANHVLGLLKVDCPLPQLHAFLSAPPVPLEQAALLAESLTLNTPNLPQPKIYANPQKINLTPQPILCFDALDLDEMDFFYTVYYRNEDFLFLKEIIFQYGNIRVPASQIPTNIYYEEQGELIEVVRNIALEKAKQKECEKLLPSRTLRQHELLWQNPHFRNFFILKDCHTEDDLDYLHHDIVPLFKQKGWKIEFNHPVYAEVLKAEELEWFSQFNEESSHFFSYELGILVDGKPVSIVPLVADLINKNTNIDELADDFLIHLPLPQGKRLQIKMARIKPLMRFLLNYGTFLSNDERKLKISRYQFLLMQETEQAIFATKARWQGGEAIRGQLQQLINTQELKEITPPKGLNATLRDYQQQGLAWLQLLRQSQFNGILADDMGLGKTIQTLAHLQLEKEQGRLKSASLIIAPTSLVGNWEVEGKRFTPDLKVLVFHGTERYNGSFDEFDIVISTYGLVQRDKPRFINYHFYYLILDEAQFIKNARTKTTQIIQQINAQHRLCLSGTPLENHLGELWSLFHFLMPGLLEDAKQFRKFFKIPIEKNNDNEKRTILAKRVSPFILRRTKNQVAHELPPKTETTQRIELVGPQRDLYEAIRMSMEKKVRDAIAKQGLNKSHIIFLDALLKLRQICCDPRLLTLPDAVLAHGTSVKLEALLALLDNLMAEKRRVLVFSQFTSMLKLIEEQLQARHYTYLKLTGQTQNRQQLVNKFQEGNFSIFLISLKAGGTGLNLTRADTVIHYDPWWNPAVEDQATDRTHRIGQENPVFVYKLITIGTVEEIILAMQNKKRELFDGILADKSSGMTALTVDDIAQFFMPLRD